MDPGLHLYRSPSYRAADGTWHRSFREAVERSPAGLSWDVSAILSALSLRYVYGERTLVREVRRTPWLSTVDEGGEVRLHPIPPHGRRWWPAGRIAAELHERLREEARAACRGRRAVYLLLSGGLDSRIVAGVVAELVAAGEIEGRPVGFTWGLADSRDVQIARAVAGVLGFEWVHIPLGPEDVRRNIEAAAPVLAGLVSPIHLHGMRAVAAAVPADGVVLAASYGDSVGRGAFALRHLLELEPMRPADRYGLLEAGALEAAAAGLQGDLDALHGRTPGEPTYVLCEHAMAVRGANAHAMELIHAQCRVYQMFTDPAVYGSMWSIHPSLRSDAAYGRLLERLQPELTRLPWARTNRALRGRTVGRTAGLRRAFQDYAGWISGPLYDELYEAVDPAWFAATGVFRAAGVEALRRGVRVEPGLRNCEALLWLAGLRELVRWLEAAGKRVEAPALPAGGAGAAALAVPERRPGWLRRRLRGWRTLHGLVSGGRRLLARGRGLLAYPPQRDPARRGE